MKERAICFNTSGYDGFLDFIKAYAILGVLFVHTFLPYTQKMAVGVWCDMQVPLFILIQAFHFFKRSDSRFSFKKCFTRVLLPFVLVEVFAFLVAFATDKCSLNSLLYQFIYGGGYGPGAYYPWIYLQIAILLPFAAIILNKVNKYVSLIIFIFVCEGLEVVLSITNFPDPIYRLLSIRYFFLLYLGWLWAKDGVKINGLTILLSLLSLISIIYFEYFSINDEPWFYKTGWSYHRWPCYFFVANGFIVILNKVWQFCFEKTNLNKAVRFLASNSYEIFLVQMTTIFLIEKDIFRFVENESVRYGFWICCIWALSLLGGYFINRIIKQVKRI